MKKRTFVLTLVLIGLLLSLAFIWKKRGQSVSSEILRVAFPYNHPARFYEPTRIHLAPEYIFLENTFSPLVELSPQDGAVQKGIAEKWEWRSDELFLHIRPGLMTIDGYEITAKDAAFSLKRLLVRTGNTHGNFKDLVCGAAKLKSLSDPCSGIRVEGNVLILKIAGKSAFVLPMLSGIDFAVIPERSVDPVTLDIVDYRNTSGPYYVSQDSDRGEIELSLNPVHYHAAPKVPKKIMLVPTNPKDKTASLELFRKRAVDFITTIDSALPEQIFLLSKELRETSLHATANIRTFSLFFTERGIQELSQGQRILIGRKIKDVLHQHFLKLPGYENADQFFPTHGDGAIEVERAKELANRASQDALESSLPVRVSVVRSGDVATYRKLISKVLPEILVEEGRTAPAFERYETPSDMPHAYIAGPDTGFNEDISLISYALTAGFFGLTPEARERWLAEYMVLSEKAPRLEKLRSIHEAALSEVYFVPLFSSPYTALARSPWKIQLSKILANNPLWLINND